MRQTSVTAEIMSIHKLMNSTSGNPRWKVFTTKGTYITESDSQVGFDIVNEMYRDTRVKFTLSPQNKITHAKVLGEPVC